MFCCHGREEEKHVEDDDGEDLVAKAERDFFAVVEAEKKIRDEKEAKSRAALADVDEEQKGVTSEDYKESEEKPSNGEAQVGYLSTQVYCFGE